MNLQRCAYCGAERLESELKRATIFFRSSRFDLRKGRMRQFVDERSNLYCVDKACASRDQMAHEG